MEASLQIQTALVDSLRTKGFSVFDYRPKKETPYPFILVGDDRQSDLDVKNADYTNVVSTVLVFSTYKGKKEVKQLMEAVRQSGLALKTNVYNVAGVTMSDSFTVEDKENGLTQGIVEFNIKLIKGA